jgi:hypothetical protein
VLGSAQQGHPAVWATLIDAAKAYGPEAEQCRCSINRQRLGRLHRRW